VAWSIASWWHWLGMVVFWGLVLVVAVWAIARVTSVDRSCSPTARALLDERLARGDLDPEQYRQMRELIEH
jgi:putative membrane protein